MAKPRAVPSESSRESPAFWNRMVQASMKRREASNAQYARFARWHRGDLRDVVNPDVLADEPFRWQSGLDNMLSLATTASMADLFFRWPRFVVRTPYISNSDPRFNPGLARCETDYLAYTMRAVNFRKKARRVLQDALLCMGVLKITAEPDVAVDEETLQAAQDEARKEITDFLAHGVKMKAQDDQLHAVHIAMKEEVLTQAEQGAIQLPKPALKYLKKHIELHKAMRGSERPTETVRTNMLRVRRINPLDYNWDPTADDRDDVTWREHRYLMRRADVLSNPNFDKDALAQLGMARDRWENRGSFSPIVKTPGSYDVPDDMVMVHEVFDLVEQRRILYADGGTIALQIQDRGELAVLQPSGPFIELVFTEDCMEGQAVPPPNSFEAEQAAATHISSSNVAAAVQSQARTMYNSRYITSEDAARVWMSPVGEFIPVAPKGEPNMPLENCFAQVPASEIKQQNLVVYQNCIQGIERRSGLGVSKMGGGEFAATATGAALGADASNSISEDRGATVDEFSETCARHMVRLTRRYTPKSQIVNVCGEEAMEVWPDRWTISDSANDIGVDIIPGSSRRRNTAVDQKQLLDGIMAFAKDPAMQGPEAVKLRVQMNRMYFEDGGVTGLDWQSVADEAQQVAMLQHMQMFGIGAPPAAPGAPPGDGTPGPEAQGAPESAPPTAENDVQQGVQNVGGGRIAAPGGNAQGAAASMRSQVMKRGAERGQ